MVPSNSIPAENISCVDLIRDIVKIRIIAVCDDGAALLLEISGKTISAISVPVRSRFCRVSRSGMSNTTMAACFSFVSTRHCSRISS